MKQIRQILFHHESYSAVMAEVEWLQQSRHADEIRKETCQVDQKRELEMDNMATTSTQLNRWQSLDVWISFLD